MSRKNNAPLGAVLVACSSVFYASYGIWTKLMGEAFGGYMASGLRCVLVVAFLLVPAYYFRRLETLKLRRNWRYLAGMVVSSTMIWGPFYYSILHAGIGVSLTINYVSIVIGMLVFGWLLGGERFTAVKAAATVLGMFGVALVFSPNLHTVGLLPLLAAVLSGLASAAGMVLAKEIHYNETQSTLVLWVVSAFTNMLMALALKEQAPALGLNSRWLALVLFALASVAASWLFVKGLKLIESGVAGILGLLEIVFGVLFGVLFFHEKPGLLVLLGALVIIVAAALPSLKKSAA